MKSITDSKALTAILRENFGITELRPGQEEVIASVIAGHDTLAIMPTGAGKSLCYQLPALSQSGTTVVVSPLISLMKDQADKIDAVGIDAAQMNGTLSNRDEAAVMKSLKEAKREIIFTTPERLATADFISVLKGNSINLFVIDEAHCISQWGHDFRPAFLDIADVIRTLGKPTVLALTATATAAVIDDIIKQLKLPDMRVVHTGIHRSNLHFAVIHVTNPVEKLGQVLRLARENEGTGIVYTATVKAAEEVHAALQQMEPGTALYHGQLSAKERKLNQDAFMEGAARIMVATNAFGMGINKTDIRFIVHYQIPASLEAYYQEAGRAGRDGQRARCTLLYDIKDKNIQQFFLAHRYPALNEISAVYETLRRLQAKDNPATFTTIRSAMPHTATAKQLVALKLLKDAHLVAQERNHRYRLLHEKISRAELARMANEYRQKGEHDQEMLRRMVFYAQSGFCRWKVLLEYFSEKLGWERCGTCDNCLRPPERALNALRRRKPLYRGESTKKDAGIFRTGERVKVPKYGEGRVISAAADKVTIAFPDSQVRTFLRLYVEPCA